MRQTINRGQTSYDPNNLRGGCPFQAGMDMSGFASYAERSMRAKFARSPSFFDHFSQATMFFNSQSETEQNHIVKALRFELGKVETPPIRERMLALLAQVDKTLANKVAAGLGLSIPTKLDHPLNMSVPADGDPKKFQPKRVKTDMGVSPVLSMVNNLGDAVKTRKVAFVVGDGFDDTSLLEMKKALMTAGAKVMTVAPHLGVLTGQDGEVVKADFSLLTASSVLFDAVYVPSGQASIESLLLENESTNFVLEAYRHCKTIGAAGAGVELLRAAGLPVVAMSDGSNGQDAEPGVVVGDGDIAVLATGFIEAMRLHRHWNRESTETQTGEQPLMTNRPLQPESRV
jgi:catalase